MFTITEERLPIEVWAEELDDQTLEQCRHLARLPFAFHHIAVMADAHVGFGMPIGGVLAAEGRVVPHAVGLDIGCGVLAWRTNVPGDTMRKARHRILNDVQRSVPQGFEWHGKSQEHRTDLFGDVPDIHVLRQELDKAAKQIGTLGGGNHFIELQVDEDDIAWAMVHSGSRNLGKQVADHYDDMAKAEDDTGVPPEWGLASLDLGSAHGQEYVAAMEWCLRFAKENRRLMAESVRRAIDRALPGFAPDPADDVHHNYASSEEHFGREVMVHRKGAVRAVGTVVVPGSMGTASYVCKGLAEPKAFESCSHGAGRRIGRKEAMRTLQREKVLAGLKERDVDLLKSNKRDVAEEAPEAYKDIEDVMALQRDLVEPLVRLTPIGVVKG